MSHNHQQPLDEEKVSLEEVMQLHGMGNSALARIRVIMDAKHIRFRNQ